MSEVYMNNLIAVALMARAVAESAKEPKGHYVLVSKAKLNSLREALKLLSKDR